MLLVCDTWKSIAKEHSFPPMGVTQHRVIESKCMSLSPSCLQNDLIAFDGCNGPVLVDLVRVALTSRSGFDVLSAWSRIRAPFSHAVDNSITNFESAMKHTSAYSADQLGPSIPYISLLMRITSNSGDILSDAANGLRV